MNYKVDKIEKPSYRSLTIIMKDATRSSKISSIFDITLSAVQQSTKSYGWGGVTINWTGNHHVDKKTANNFKEMLEYLMEAVKEWEMKPGTPDTNSVRNRRF